MPTAAPHRQTLNLTLDKGMVRAVGITVAAGLFLALSGVFGTHQAPLGLRLAYWLPIMAAGGLWGHVCSRLVERFVSLDERPWLMALVLTLIMWGPLSVLVWAVTGPVFVGRLHSLGALPVMALYVLLVTTPIAVISVFVGKSQPVQTHAPAPGRTETPARFLERFPPKLRGARLIAVEAEDHYLRLHTDRGSDLILMRLGDALAELEGLEGAQTHRSWWVARDAVRAVERGDGRAVLTLETGLAAPVSRRYARALRAAGWY